MKIGILGGAFDPIHNAHLILAQEAYEQLALDQLLLVPADTPPYKSIVEPFGHRLVMVVNSTAADARFGVSDIEFRERTSYTIDTLNALLASRLGPDDDLYLILGGDQAEKFFTWRDPERILDLTHVIATERDLATRGKILKRWQAHNHSLDLDFLKLPKLEISSTLIRGRIKGRRSIRYLVPAVVEEYIERERLYR